MNEKSIYQRARDKFKWSREKASSELSKLGIEMSEDTIERIETYRNNIYPENVVKLSKVYKEPLLCYHYCANECEIGKMIKAKNVDEQEFSNIVIQTLNSINQLDKQKEKLLEIAEDGTISENEYGDFESIKANLDKIAKITKDLQLWLDKMYQADKIKKKF